MYVFQNCYGGVTPGPPFDAGTQIRAPSPQKSVCRRGRPLGVPKTVTEFRKRSFTFAGPHFWNKLTIKVRQSPSVNIFKRRQHISVR